MTIEELFWSKVSKTENCWEWLGGKDRGGYGKFWYERRTRGAHRIAWFFTHGEAPGELGVLHKCDNPGCVNPGHLFLGTAKDNAADKYAKGRQGSLVRPKWEAHCRAKLTSQDVVAIRKRYAEGGIGTRKLAALYGMDKTAICHLLAERSWKGLDSSV